MKVQSKLFMCVYIYIFITSLLPIKRLFDYILFNFGKETQILILLPCCLFWLQVEFSRFLEIFSNLWQSPII